MIGDNIRPLRRPQVIDEDTLQAIEEQIAAARRGEVVDMVLVCNRADDAQFFRASQFADAWRLLGALEYAKDSVLRGMNHEG